MNREELMESFEAWYKVEYEWYMQRARRGYKLSKDSEGNYEWDHPRHDFKVWCAAMSRMSK